MTKAGIEPWTINLTEEVQHHQAISQWTKCSYQNIKILSIFYKYQLFSATGPEGNNLIRNVVKDHKHTTSKTGRVKYLEHYRNKGQREDSRL